MGQSIKYSLRATLKGVLRVGGWVGEGEGKGGALVYEAYEVTKKGENYAVFYFAGKRFFFLYL